MAKKEVNNQIQNSAQDQELEKYFAENYSADNTIDGPRLEQKNQNSQQVKTDAQIKAEQEAIKAKQEHEKEMQRLKEEDEKDVAELKAIEKKQHERAVAEEIEDLEKKAKVQNTVKASKKKDEILANLSKSKAGLLSDLKESKKRTEKIKQDYFKKDQNQKTLKSGADILAISLKQAQTEASLKKIKDKIAKQEEKAKVEKEKAEKERQLKLAKEEEERKKRQEQARIDEEKRRELKERIEERERERREKKYSFETTTVDEAKTKVKKRRKPLKRRLGFIMFLVILLAGLGIGAYFIVTNLLLKPESEPLGFVYAINETDIGEGKVAIDTDGSLILSENVSINVSFSEAFVQKHKILVISSSPSVLKLNNNETSVEIDNGGVVDLNITTLPNSTQPVGGQVDLIIRYLNTTKKFSVIVDKTVTSLKLDENDFGNVKIEFADSNIDCLYVGRNASVKPLLYSGSLDSSFTTGKLKREIKWVYSELNSFSTKTFENDICSIDSNGVITAKKAGIIYAKPSVKANYKDSEFTVESSNYVKIDVFDVPYSEYLTGDMNGTTLEVVIGDVENNENINAKIVRAQEVVEHFYTNTIYVPDDFDADYLINKIELFGNDDDLVIQKDSDDNGTYFLIKSRKANKDDPSDKIYSKSVNIKAKLNGADLTDFSFDVNLIRNDKITLFVSQKDVSKTARTIDLFETFEVKFSNYKAIEKGHNYDRDDVVIRRYGQTEELTTLDVSSLSGSIDFVVTLYSDEGHTDAKKVYETTVVLQITN